MTGPVGGNRPRPVDEPDTEEPTRCRSRRVADTFINRGVKARDRVTQGMVDRLRTQVAKEKRDQRVFRAVVEEGPIGITRIAVETGIAEHKVRYSLRMLEADGLVEPTPDGAVPPEEIDERLERMNRGIDDLVERLEALKDIL
jgi:predicted transcriptional regulator